MTTLLILSLLQAPTVQLNPLFSDGMVLQRGQDTPVWGKAAPGTGVFVEIAGQRAGARAGADGKWSLRLKSMKAGGPYNMKVTSSDGTTVTVRDILVGEVWVASGQSNMEFTEGGASDYEQAKAESKNEVRMFTVTKLSSEEPQTEVKGSWVAASPTTVHTFSAVGLAFANELNRKLGVPVGIIHTSWGGTPAESWTSRPTLNAHPNLKPMLDRHLAEMKDYPAAYAKYQQDLNTWMGERQDGQNEGFMNGWASLEFNDVAWKAGQAPIVIESIVGQDFDGAFWMRKTIDVPKEWVGKELKLELGAIDDFDTTYFNGVRVGKMGPEVDNAYATPRVYRVAPGIVREGKNVIAVRVMDTGGAGGMGSLPIDLKIGVADGSASLPLAGEWKVQVEHKLDASRPRPASPVGPGHPWAPGGLYNGMIAPLIPYGIRGAIWYQGESNADRAYQYRELFPTMISDWRKNWQEGDFPFGFVQLANYMQRKDQPGPSQWAELREAQSMTLKTLKNTGQAVIIDIGEAGDIHPKNKREVGRRIALWALNRTYGKPIAYCGPVYTGFTAEGSTIRVRFDFGPVASTDGLAPRGFSVAGADGVFHWAQAKMDGSTVIVSSTEVAKPVAVRYGWADNPDVSLTNSTGIPASPFRTDTWPGLTAPTK